MALKFVSNYQFSNFPLLTIESGKVVNATPSHNAWARQFIQGDPQATTAKTVEELKAIGIVGLYKEE